MDVKSKRKLFCEISPFTYQISVMKNRMVRHVKNVLILKKFAKKKADTLLPILIYSHKSLIRRRLGNVDMTLQENKAVNLSIAAPKISHVMIKPNEIFSFWKLLGSCTSNNGYKEGLIISNGITSKEIGGGMCQFTNLIHWMVLHTPMQIIERHHHDRFDLFPDYGRQIPFGTGTSIFYNYLDYRFKNTTNTTFQLITYVTDEYLCGEIRADKQIHYKYHVKVKDEFFSKENDVVFRNGTVTRECVDVKTGKLLSSEIIQKNHAQVMYDTSNIPIESSEKEMIMY